MFFEAVVLYNIANAAIHAVLIKNNKRIDHDKWGMFYAFFIISMCVLCNDWAILLLFSIVSRKPVFDISLNLMRGLNPFYASKTTTSVIDQFLLRIFPYSPAYYQIPLLLISLLIYLL